MDKNLLDQLWKTTKTLIPASVSTEVDRYLNMRYREVSFACPYWRNIYNREDNNWVRGFLGGKGTAEEIQIEINRVLGINKEIKNISDIYQVLKQKKIGVDCSGLVYNLIDLWQKSISGESIDLYITPTPGGDQDNPKRMRTNANFLTSQWNSSFINDLLKIKAGDLIRLERGKHVVLVLSKLENKILYVHSSESNKSVHLGYLLILDNSSSLQDCFWYEYAESNGLVKRNYFDLDKGDGVTRFHWWS